VIDLPTRRPIAGMVMSAQLASGGVATTGADDERRNVTDDDGRFVLPRVTPGALALFGYPRDPARGGGPLRARRTVTGRGTIDVGELGVISRRLRDGEVSGYLGLSFATEPPDAAPAQRGWRVRAIDPSGPCAALDVAVGDVVTTIDGVDVGGDNRGNAVLLWSAPPGTTLRLGLARGVTVAVVLVVR
jgi:S1-C subfamily serine protease